MRIALLGQSAFGEDVRAARRDAAEEAGMPVLVTRDLLGSETFEANRAWGAEPLVLAFVADIVRERPRRGAAERDPVPPLLAAAASMAFDASLADHRPASRPPA